MIKQMKRIMYPLVALLIISVIGIKALAAPLTFRLSSEIGEFNYLGDTYGVKAIKSNEVAEIAYCLEINDDYPKPNHTYTSNGNANEEISKLLDISFPMVSSVDMKVDDDMEAYLATQITLWALVDGFDINKITTKNKNTQRAIKRLYKEVKANPTSQNKYPTYTPNNKSIQDLVTIKSTLDIKPEQPKDPSGNDNSNEIKPEEGNKVPSDPTLEEKPSNENNNNNNNNNPEGNTGSSQTEDIIETPVEPAIKEPIKDTQPRISELG